MHGNGEQQENTNNNGNASILLTTHLKTVNARHVSVTAYHDRSMRCSNSAALSRPKNNFRIIFPTKITNTKAWM